MLKPKGTTEAYIYFENCKQTAEIQNRCTLLEHIMVLSTRSQKCIVSELYALENWKMKVEHAVECHEKEMNFLSVF